MAVQLVPSYGRIGVIIAVAQAKPFCDHEE
jgi:hypothetical protein